MKIFPEVPVDAYVSPCGFKETDHAKPKKKKESEKKNPVWTIIRTYTLQNLGPSC
jgi:isopenicillin N synthase-like dioxygenase